MLSLFHPFVLTQAQYNKISVILNALLTALCTIISTLCVASCVASCFGG